MMYLAVMHILRCNIYEVFVCALSLSSYSSEQQGKNKIRPCMISTQVAFSVSAVISL
jgi:hypothetical protein